MCAKDISLYLLNFDLDLLLDLQGARRIEASLENRHEKLATPPLNPSSWMSCRALKRRDFLSCKSSRMKPYWLQACVSSSNRCFFARNSTLKTFAGSVADVDARQLKHHLIEKATTHAPLGHVTIHLTWSTPTHRL